MQLRTNAFLRHSATWERQLEASAEQGFCNTSALGAEIVSSNWKTAIEDISSCLKVAGILGEQQIFHYGIFKGLVCL